MKMFDALLWLSAIVMSLIGIPIAMDLVAAVGAESCKVAVQPDCYPWGAEGPASDSWRYGSKEVFLLSGAAFVICASGALLTLIGTRTMRTNLNRLFVVLGIILALGLRWI